jgi:transcriptional regulator with XRE-family HTH domain
MDHASRVCHGPEWGAGCVIRYPCWPPRTTVGKYDSADAASVRPKECPVWIGHSRVGAEVPESALMTYANELKAWRERMELTQSAFADKLGYSVALVAAVEQCKRSPTLDFAARCDEVSGAPGTFVRWQAQVARESYPAFFAPVLAFERDAARIHGWELGAVPGLLQTEAYAEAVIRARNASDSGAVIERIVTARMERQELLDAEKPMLWYTVHEGVLRHQVGGRAVMAGQLDKLIELATVRRIVLQVLPYTARDHAGVEGPITVYEFDDAPSVVYTECYGGGRIVEDRQEVGDLVTVMSLIRSCALSPADSMELIRDIRRDHEQ